MHDAPDVSPRLTGTVPRETAADAPAVRAERTQELSGALPAAPLGRLGRALVYGTGIFLLRPAVLLLARLVGYARRATLRLEGERGLHIEEVVTLLGATVLRRGESIPIQRVVSVAACERRATEPILLGGLLATLGILWGLWQVADGLYGRSLGLVGLGLLAAAAGVAADLAFFSWAHRWPRLSQRGAAVHLTDGRSVAVWGTGDPAPFVSALAAAIGASAPRR